MNDPSNDNQTPPAGISNDLPGAIAAGCTRLAVLLADLSNTRNGHMGGIRAVRREIRSLRGGLRLLGGHRAATAELRAVSRALADPREAIRRLGVWRKLAHGGDSLVERAISALLNHQTSAPAMVPPPELIEWCLERVQAASAIVASRKNRDGIDIEKRLKLMKRSAAGHCLGLPRGKDFHGARKALREWVAAAAFAGGDENARMLPHTGTLHGYLRDVRDLANFETWLAGHGFSKAMAPALWEAIEGAKSAARNQAIAAAKEVFAP